MTDDIKNKMIGTLAWTMFDRFGQQVIQFVISVFLARLLTPNEYTLIALVVVFVSLSNSLVDGGFGSALVRKKTVDDTDLSTVFYFNVFVSILLYTLLYFAAPFIADFYEQPKLVEISRIIFLAILLNAFYLIPNIKLVRKIDVKIIALVNIVSVFFSGIIGILMAANNLGVWALVGQQLSFQLIRVLTVYYFEAWNPKFLFSFKVIKESFSFSSNMLLTTVLNNIFNYVYILILGKFFQKQEVGLYYQANKLNDASSFSFQVILGSTYNVFVKIQDEGERLLWVYRELVRQSSIVTIPLILFLVAVAEPLFFVLFTDKWMGAVPYFKMLSLASLFNPTYTLISRPLKSP